MDKMLYRAAEGVAWVNGAPVPASGAVLLTEQEALYDLGLGRIERAEPAAPITSEPTQAPAKRPKP